MKNSYFEVAIINLFITVIMVVVSWTTIFPASTIAENGDITFNARGLLIDHVEIQEFITNTETLETELVYWVEPIDVRDTEITISNKEMAQVEQTLFNNNNAECKITFGKVVAIPRLMAILVLLGAYLYLTLYLVPSIYKDLFSSIYK